MMDRPTGLYIIKCSGLYVCTETVNSVDLNNNYTAEWPNSMQSSGEFHLR
jgi:hypothetical protein